MGLVQIAGENRNQIIPFAHGVPADIDVDVENIISCLAFNIEIHHLFNEFS